MAMPLRLPSAINSDWATCSREEAGQGLRVPAEPLTICHSGLSRGGTGCHATPLSACRMKNFRRNDRKVPG